MFWKKSAAPQSAPTSAELDKVAAKYRDEARRAKEDLCAARLALATMEFALGDIVKMETPSCASIGKRMAARARKALPDMSARPKWTERLAQPDAAASNGVAVQH